jgi:cyclophilin family peptidyl-prolyl cis-trans isomerase
MNILRLAFAGALFLAGASLAQAADFLTIQLKDGPVVIELNSQVAPKHVERMKALAAAGEYDNVAFHRVIEGFMAQTGDVQYGDMENGFQPQAAGTGGSSQADLPAEFSNVPFERGTVGMARGRRTRTPPTRSSSSCSRLATS